ncbi:HNH endonuclease family protein [Streptomyces sp. NPDC101171]|uniref:HNH endonuclease family protein n=1 Tax=Streptomyces sp. NPDC101171 TaxID=3366122 RepID=UPI00382B13B8
MRVTAARHPGRVASAGRYEDPEPSGIFEGTAAPCASPAPRPRPPLSPPSSSHHRPHGRRPHTGRAQCRGGRTAAARARGDGHPARPRRPGAAAGARRGPHRLRPLQVQALDRRRPRRLQPRAEVLKAEAKAEAIIAPEQGPRCALSGGQWYSAYDDRYISGPSGLDIDHLVPLAEAWDSGASTWTAAAREAYANDLGDDRALIAVSAASNRSKADQDPTSWLPPAVAYRCQYVTDWVVDKTR